jgi:hypothetical protein
MERTEEEIQALKAKRAFKKFTWQGIELEQLLEITHAELATMCRARIRRRFQRGLKRKPMALIKKLRQAKANMANPMGKPEAVKVRDSPAAATPAPRQPTARACPDHDGGGARERGRHTRMRPRALLAQPPRRYAAAAIAASACLTLPPTPSHATPHPRHHRRTCAT